jgi:hypothetical protein
LLSLSLSSLPLISLFLFCSLSLISYASLSYASLTLLHLAVMIVVASSPHCVVVFLLTQAAIDDDTSERMEATCRRPKTFKVM